MKSARIAALYGGVMGLGTLLLVAAMSYTPAPRPVPLPSKQLTAHVAVAGQLSPAQVAELRERGFATIIAMRPDGEEAGQPLSAAVAEAARANRMKFAYVPIPKGDIIPDGGVAALLDAMARNPEPVLLYCRSGRRAARAWSLAEASRARGANAGAILSTVRASGHSADDLAASINQRIARRHVVHARAQ